jgi:hypothetical protein
VLKIDRKPASWATVGFSEGGTCAIGLAVEHPDAFGRFVDLAGDQVPNDGINQAAATTLKKLYRPTSSRSATPRRSGSSPIATTATRRRGSRS